MMVEVHTQPELNNYKTSFCVYIYLAGVMGGPFVQEQKNQMFSMKLKKLYFIFCALF